MNDWKQEYKELKKLSKKQLELLEKGPDSLAASWSLNAMYQDWKRIKNARSESGT